MKLSTFLPVLSLLFALLLCSGSPFIRAENQDTRDKDVVAQSINSFGAGLFERMHQQNENLVLSPLSIHTALSMAALGASGETKDEMEEVLQLSSHQIRSDYAALLSRPQAIVESDSRSGSNNIEINTANRLYVEQSFALQAPFLAEVRSVFGAPAELINFRGQFEPARLAINRWVSAETKEKIMNLLPAGSIKTDTRLVLVNALYVKAPWSLPFEADRTKDDLFTNSKGQEIRVPTMFEKAQFGYKKDELGELITLPYRAGGLELSIFLPAANSHLSQSSLLNKAFDTRDLPQQEIQLYLPKFKVEGSTMALQESLIAMGLSRAFDLPAGSADFSLMAPKTKDLYLAVSEVYHKTFFSIDEQGTEAAAATAVVMDIAGAIAHHGERPPVPIVKVNRPFFFTLRDTKTKAAFFLGYISDP